MTSAIAANNPIGRRDRLGRSSSITFISTYGNIEQYIAGATLSGHRIVIADPATGKAIYAQHNDNTHAHAAFKLTLQAAVLDDPVEVKLHGRVTEGSWAWTPGATLYLKADGQLTEIIPTTGVGATFSRPVAVAETATRILLLQHPPIILV